MAVHVHVSTKNINNAEIHHMPCTIKWNGEANVSKYFKPNISKSGNGLLKASFRGYPLVGREMVIPDNYSGLVIQETKERLTEESDRNVYGSALFNKLTYWNYDEMPSSNDKLASVMNWIDISLALLKVNESSEHRLTEYLPGPADVFGVLIKTKSEIKLQQETA